MTVGQMIEQLSQYPKNMDVFMAERKTEFKYGLINSITTIEINLMEDINDEEPFAIDKIVIVDEE